MERKVALITGGTSGIGAAYARHFASEGYDLIVTGHPDDEILLRTEELKEKFHIQIETILADFSSESHVSHIEDILLKNQRIEVLVNCAGFGLGRAFFEREFTAVMSMIQVNTIAPVRFINAILPQMIKNKRGIIITVSSISSLVPVPRDPLYCGTKAFHNILGEALHIRMIGNGIKCQVLCPGLVRSNFHNRIGTYGPRVRARGFVRWMDPDKVVAISIRNLKKKHKVIVIPGFLNKISVLIYNLIPRTLYYRFACNLIK